MVSIRVDYFFHRLIEDKQLQLALQSDTPPPARQSADQPANCQTNDAKTLQRGSLHTTVACSAASLELADT